MALPGERMRDCCALSNRPQHFRQLCGISSSRSSANLIVIVAFILHLDGADPIRLLRALALF